MDFQNRGQRGCNRGRFCHLPCLVIVCFMMCFHQVVELFIICLNITCKSIKPKVFFLHTHNMLLLFLAVFNILRVWKDAILLCMRVLRLENAWLRLYNSPSVASETT